MRTGVTRIRTRLYLYRAPARQRAVALLGMGQEAISHTSAVSAREKGLEWQKWRAFAL